mgnify:CR=1 FL=1|tara:strand:+ start:464 stop:838 length:375 start_codon:yes stop_codon:yes gene_type:complete
MSFGLIPTYRPLPSSLRLGFSKIHDLGVFAKEKIERGTNLGMSHVKIGTQLIRTPLGGFLNHSEKPNCHKTKLRYTNQDDPKIKFDYVAWNLVVLEDIKEGEELTITYEWYKPSSGKTAFVNKK